MTTTKKNTHTQTQKSLPIKLKIYFIHLEEAKKKKNIQKVYWPLYPAEITQSLRDKLERHT